MDRFNIGGMKPARELAAFVKEVLAGTALTPEAFWTGFARIVADLGPRNRALLAERARLKSAIDDWHKSRRGKVFELAPYKAFLKEIGYLAPEPGAVRVETDNVDAEIATIAGPQLVVPLSNARYALNAANARWGSLYDALYGTDAIPEAGDLARGGAFNPRRAAAVVARGKAFLDEAAPLANAQHDAVSAYVIKDGRLTARLKNGESAGLRDPDQLRGYRGAPAAPDTVLLAHHGLHFEIQIDRNHLVGTRRSGGRLRHRP